MRRYLYIIGNALLILMGVAVLAIAIYFWFFSDDEIPLEEPSSSPPVETIEEPAEEPQELVSHDFEVPEYDCSNVPGAPVEGEPTPSDDVCDTEIVEPEAEVLEPTAPSHLTIDAIGVDHPIISVGLNDDGSMEIPHNVNELGWYEPGVKPGEYGSAVIAGHVDSRAQGPGAFFDLRHLKEGDEIIITDDDGVVLTWDVSRITRYNKDQTPMDDIFRWEGDSRDLVLVTCGGEFDRTARSYEDNIVVYASFRDD